MLKKFVDKIRGKKEELPEEKTLINLTPGCFLDYFMQSWQVKECYEYDWGNNFFTQEYMIDNGSEKKYLHVEEEGELKLSISEEVSIMSVDKELKAEIISTDKPPKKIHYKDKYFYMSGENQGYFRDKSENDWSEFVSWEFCDEDEKEFVSVMRWGETDFTASFGQFVNEYEFSNFIPSNQ